MVADRARSTANRLTRAARLRPGRYATHAATRRSGVTKVPRRMGGGDVAADAGREDVSMGDARAARLRPGRKATHAAARRSGATKVPRGMGGGDVAADAGREDGSSGDAHSDIDTGDPGRKATHTAARRSGATKVPRRMGGGEVAADARREDGSIGDAHSDIDTGDDTEDDTGGRAAKKRPSSPQKYSTDHSADEEAVSTNEGAPRAAYTAVARGAAARRAATQREKGNPKADHEAASEVDQVEDSGEEADPKAKRRTHPMKNRADAKALPKFFRGAPAGSKEEDEADSEADSKANRRPHPMKNRAHAGARPILLAWRPIEGRADCDPPGSTPNRLANNPQVPGATPKGQECFPRGLGPNRKDGPTRKLKAQTPGGPGPARKRCPKNCPSWRQHPAR